MLLFVCFFSILFFRSLSLSLFLGLSNTHKKKFVSLAPICFALNTRWYFQTLKDDFRKKNQLKSIATNTNEGRKKNSHFSLFCWTLKKKVRRISFCMDFFCVGGFYSQRPRSKRIYDSRVLWRVRQLKILARKEYITSLKNIKKKIIKILNEN